MSPFHLSLDLLSLRALPDGEGFELECRDGEQCAVSVRFPVQALHQLMRDLPRVEAALLEGGTALSAAIAARPVVDWYVGGEGEDGGLALCIRTPGDVESGFSFQREEALAFHRELGHALAPARCATAGPSSAVAPFAEARPEPR